MFYKFSRITIHIRSSLQHPQSTHLNLSVIVPNNHKTLCRHVLGTSQNGPNKNGLNDLIVLFTIHCKYPISHDLIDVYLYQFFTC